MKSLCLTAAALALPLLAGCSSQLSTVNLQGSASVASASVLVDVVGISPNNQSLKLLPVGQYWRGGSAQRRGDGKSFRFGPGAAQSDTIAPGDPIWKHWHDTGVTEIMVVADLPGAFPDLPGDADPRRKLLPLSSKTTTATVTVDKSGLLKSNP